MVTPLYKFLKTNGTSFFAFPGSAEDISASYQNGNYKMYFSKFVLLNIPKRNLTDPGGTSSEYLYWDTSTFSSLSLSPPTNYGDLVIESLRNYVANHEVTLRESRLNNTEYYYDTTALETTSEKIFFKWAKKLGLVSWEPALPQDEYFDNLEEFQRNDLTDDNYFPEYLWRERDVETTYDITSFISSTGITYPNRLELTINGFSNFRVNDIIIIDGISDSTLTTEVYGGATWSGPIKVRVLEVTDSTSTQTVIVDFNTAAVTTVQTTATAKLYYNRFVQYIGEVNGVSNIQEANISKTSVYAHIPDHAGKTPDILYRTLVDDNYKPGMIFPIIPSQYQPEIIGSELFSSPIVSNPTNYPGSYYGYFDTEDFTYETSNGDSFRRSGDYFGVSGDINSPVVDGSTIDGVNIDFNTSHYVKMNLEDRAISTFDQFNALEVNNDPPQDFDFNAILWYYTVEDSSGNRRSNLYGISFLDHPDNNPVSSEVGIKFPIFKKLATTDTQDGTAYGFSLNLNFNIIHDNPQEAYNPESINSLFSMNLFNEAMRRLELANDSFLDVISQHSALKDELQKIKQLVYTQTDLNVINSRISNLENLLKLYSSLQISSSETIEVELVNDTSPSSIKLNSIETKYSNIFKLRSTEMYSSTGIIPIEITPPQYKNFLINVENNDDVSLVVPGNDNLKLLLSTDLQFRQSVDILINSTGDSTENKKLDIFISTINPLGLTGSSTTDITPIETLLVGDIDLPVFLNSITSQPNSAKTWKKFNFDIDFDKNITLDTGNLLKLSLDGNFNVVYNSVKEGDILRLNNLFVGTSSVFDFSGQYIVDTVSATNSEIILDVSSNVDFVAYGSGLLPLTIHSTSSTILSNNPYIDLNKGYMINITRISDEDQINVLDKYLITINDMNY